MRLQRFPCISFYISRSFTADMCFKAFSIFHSKHRSQPFSPVPAVGLVCMDVITHGLCWLRRMVPRYQQQKGQGSEQTVGKVRRWLGVMSCLFAQAQKRLEITEWKHSRASWKSLPWIFDLELSMLPTIFNACLAGTARSVTLIAGTGGAVAYPILS